MSYNGWSNYETWNVNLWIENDKGLYRCKRENIEQRLKLWPEKPITGDDVKAFYVAYMNATTPDLTNLQEASDHVDAINYDEIAEHWELERQAMLPAA